jgi:hypothetical protein
MNAIRSAFRRAYAEQTICYWQQMQCSIVCNGSALVLVVVLSYHAVCDTLLCVVGVFDPRVQPNM